MLGNVRLVPRRSLANVRLYRVDQDWDQPCVSEISAATADALEDAQGHRRIQPGQTIAITAGSRGIADMPEVLRAVVDQVRARGAEPFLFPAMGSHAGGMPEGQKELLERLGLGEKAIGAPIRAGMEVVQIGATPEGFPVKMDRIAAEADGVIVVNRIKKHPNFDGPIESGLCKMVVIGMGKYVQAAAVHQLGNTQMSRMLVPMAQAVFDSGHVIGGIALIENARGRLAEVIGLPSATIAQREPALLARAKELSAKLPVRQADIAIVETMGKEISGTGMDCHTIGRRRIIGELEWTDTPRLHSLVALRLSDASHGNAVGVGLADFVPRSLVEKIDWGVTYANAMTSGNLERIKLPVVCENDADALEAASFRERAKPVDELRIVCLRDTLHLESIYVSAPLLAEMGGRTDLAVHERAPVCLPLDADGKWRSLWSI